MQLNPILSSYINTIERLNPSDVWDVMNHKLEFIAISPNMTNMLLTDNIIGLGFRDLHSPYTSSADHIFEVSTKNLIDYAQIYQEYLVLKMQDELISSYSLRATKITDPITQEFLGVAHFFNQISQYPYIIKKMYHLKNNLTFIPTLEHSGLYEPAHFYGQFNERDQIIIWLLILGKQVKEIVVILENILQKEFSLNAVSSIIHRSIYQPLQIKNNYELLFLLNKNEALSSIPQKLFDYLINKSSR